tara:strand:+ start:440 stop:775 length:336 start_codon:yes stop_codon:yes gene_type:complete
MIFSAIAYITMSSLSIFGGFELVKKCSTDNNEETININNLTIEDVEKIEQVLDLSFNNLKKIKKISSIHDILEEDVDDVELIGKKNTSKNQYLLSYLPYIYSDNDRAGMFF